MMATDLDLNKQLERSEDVNIENIPCYREQIAQQNYKEALEDLTIPRVIRALTQNRILSTAQVSSLLGFSPFDSVIYPLLSEVASYWPGLGIWMLDAGFTSRVDVAVCPDAVLMRKVREYAEESSDGALLREMEEESKCGEREDTLRCTLRKLVENHEVGKAEREFFVSKSTAMRAKSVKEIQKALAKLGIDRKHGSSRQTLTGEEARKMVEELNAHSRGGRTERNTICSGIPPYEATQVVRKERTTAAEAHELVEALNACLLGHQGSAVQVQTALEADYGKESDGREARSF